MDINRQIEIPEQTFLDVQSMLSSQGKSMDVAAFVNRTLERALFFETIQEVKRRNAGVDPSELQKLIDEAVDEVRAEIRQGGEAESRADST